MSIKTSIQPTTDKIDLAELRKQFPILQQKVHGKPLAYLDNAATTQKPRCVINAISNYYLTVNANVHRGIHCLSEQATNAYEAARARIKDYLHAKHVEEIIYTKGTTDSINLVAQSYGESHFNAGDEIIISEMEHHSNIIPWQLIAKKRGCAVRVIPMTEQGELDLNAYEQLFNEKTKFVALGHVSNAIGSIHPIKTMISKAHQYNVPVLIDGAQALAHFPIDVQDLDCDFYAFSGHKAYGPTGIGGLYAKKSLLEKMPPYQGGGEMIKRVSFNKPTMFNELPYKFEAGTPNIAGAIGLGAAIDFLSKLDFPSIKAHEENLLDYATHKLKQLPKLKIIGEAKEKTNIVSFIFADIHAHDLGTILDHHGVAIRAGHHCAMPIMEHFNIAATARASFACYNTVAEVDQLIEALLQARKVFS